MGVLSNLRVLNQQTLNRSASFSGIGLHSGNRVNMTVLPAPANSGVRFRRVDLEGKPEIEARVENVSETNRSTTLAKGNVKVHTVEHVLAALAGFGIDNAVVELDANEPPIADGSSREFCKIISTAGVVPLAEKREFIAPTEPIELHLGETMMTIFPYDGFKITCTSADKKGRFTQFYSTEITPQTWEKELAHARTFCFYEEIEFLIKNGLIKGGSLENAIVIREDAVLTTEPLRYPEEFAAQDARHHRRLVAARQSDSRACRRGAARSRGQRGIGAKNHRSGEPAGARGADLRAAAGKTGTGALGQGGWRDEHRGVDEVSAASPAVFAGGPDFEN